MSVSLCCSFVFDFIKQTLVLCVVDEQPEAQEVLQEPSDVEEGGLDLNKSFKAISAYMQDREEMLEQCFHVLGETKLKNMLPDELKVHF